MEFLWMAHTQKKQSNTNFCESVANSGWDQSFLPLRCACKNIMIRRDGNWRDAEHQEAAHLQGGPLVFQGVDSWFENVFLVYPQRLLAFSRSRYDYAVLMLSLSLLASCSCILRPLKCWLWTVTSASPHWNKVFALQVSTCLTWIEVPARHLCASTRQTEAVKDTVGSGRFLSSWVHKFKLVRMVAKIFGTGSKQRPPSCLVTLL